MVDEKTKDLSLKAGPFIKRIDKVMHGVGDDEPLRAVILGHLVAAHFAGWDPDMRPGMLALWLTMVDDLTGEYARHMHGC